MTAKISWRQFQLFDFTPIRDPNYQSDDHLYSDPGLSAIHATSSYLAIAIGNCFVKIINPQTFTLEKQFQAYDSDYRISAVKSVPGSNLLVTLAERQGSPAILKLWDLTKIVHLVSVESDQEQYKFQTQVLVTNGDNSYPISCFQFNDELTCIAIGYTNGKVILVRGDLLRDRGSKQRTIYESPDPVTGVNFNRKHEILYITTTSKILTVLTTGRNNGKPSKYLSTKTGVDLNCSDVVPSTQELVVATQSSIRFYNNLAKIYSIPFEVSKSKLYYIKNSSKNYLLLVSSSEEEIAANNKKKLVTRILILDLDNRHLSFNLMVPNNIITHVFELQDDIFLLSNDGVLYKLHEKPINQQIEVILQRELFSVAYKLAERNHMPQDVLMRIQRLHGDFLYTKQNYDESIEVFIKCLTLFKNTLELNEHNSNEDEEDLEDFVMNIITKFKDVSNISNLTRFLYELYSLSIANNNHITLLLCCYCKLKLTSDLDKFIDDQDLNESSDTSSFQDLNYQLIINLFQECGYFDQVIKLLFKLNQPSLIVGIQLNHLHQPKQSLEFIKGLPIDDLLLILIEHSKSFLDFLPIETTELLINVFTGKYKLNEKMRDTFIQDVKVNKEENNVHRHDNVEEESSFSLNSYKAFVDYLSSLKDSDEDSNGVKEAAKNGDDISHDEPTYLPPRPSLIYPSFMNHPNEFVIFLEACVETFDKYQGNTNDKEELLMTLFEMYLTLANESDKEEYEASQWREKAKELVESNSEFLDSSSLLLVSHIYDFKEGEALSKEQAGFEESLFISYQISENVGKCFELVKRHGDEKPDLYKSMLKFMISKQSVFEQMKQSDFRYILNKIEKSRIMNPLEILQVLTKGEDNEFVTLGLVKDYLIDFIDNQSKEINNNHKLIDYYETESTKTSHKLNELMTKPFVINNNKCSECGHKLDYPVIHFRCKHSFHQKCLNENLIATSIGDDSSLEKQCPICINEIEEVKSIRKDQLKSKEDLEVFESTLNESKDRFKFISEYLGKGVMENESVTLMD